MALDIVSALVNEDPDKVLCGLYNLNCDSRNIVSLPEVKFIPGRFIADSHGPEVKVLRLAPTVLTQCGLKIAGRRPLQIVKGPSETVPKQTGRDMQSFFPFNSKKN